MNATTTTAPMLATDLDLCKRATEICAASDRHDAVLAAADSADRADESKVAALREKLREHEAMVDPDKLEDFQITAAMKAQLAALETKVATDKVNRRAEANAKSRAAIAGMNIPAFFEAAYRHEIVRVMTPLIPFFESEGRAAPVAAQCDCVAALYRWTAILVKQIPHEIIAQRLRAFVDGSKPLWRI